MDNYCVICGKIIPEGRMVCPVCEKKIREQRRIRFGDEEGKPEKPGKGK